MLAEALVDVSVEVRSEVRAEIPGEVPMEGQASAIRDEQVSTFISYLVRTIENIPLIFRPCQSLHCF